jgi:dimethylargininase
VTIKRWAARAARRRNAARHALCRPATDPLRKTRIYEEVRRVDRERTSGRGTTGRAGCRVAFQYDVAVFVAITRRISPSFDECELTHLQRVPIDLARAHAQHRAYERALIAAGGMILQLDTSAEMPDSVFVEDVAVVLPELAIVTRPGAASRRPETAAVAHTVAAFRPVQTIEAPGTVDGGDVLVAGRRVFVGVSTRSNDAAVAQIRAMLSPLGYTVCALEVGGCLHLKSAVTVVDDATLLVNPAWVDVAAFDGFSLVEVDESEPSAANALRLPDRVVVAAAYPRTAAAIERRGTRVERVEVDELAKAEGAVTCCSVIVGPDGLSGFKTPTAGEADGNGVY